MKTRMQIDLEQCLRGRRGSTLVTVVVLVGALTVLSLIFLRVGARVTEEQLASVENSRAVYLAEAAISEAVEAMRSGGTGGIGSIDAPATLGDGVFWVEAKDLGNDLTQLDAMAMKEGGRAALRVVVDTTGSTAGGTGGGSGGKDAFFTMLFSESNIHLKQDVSIDSWDSSLGTYASQATNTKDGFTYAGSLGGAAGNGGIQVDSNVHVFGDVRPGPGESVSMSSSAYVSGSTTPANKDITLAPITLPTIVGVPLPYVVGNGQTKTINSGNHVYTNMTLGKNSKLTIKGPSTILMGGFTTGTGVTVEVDCTNGPVMVYDTGIWSVDKNFSLGPTTGSPVEAAFMISSPGTVQFDQGSKIKFGFYAPDATIKVDQGAEVWGALVASDIQIDQGTHFHFDTNLAKVELPWSIPDSYFGFDEAYGVDVVSWTKIEFPGVELRGDRRDPLSVLGLEQADLRLPTEAWEKKQ